MDQTRRRWPRALLAGTLAGIALLPILLAVLLTGGGSAGATTTLHLTPVHQIRPVAAKPSADAQPRRGALVALVLHPTTMRTAPGGPIIAGVPTRTNFGSAQTMWVVQRKPGWLGVISTLAGNNRVGWIPQSSASLGVVDWELKVSLSTRTLSVLDNGRVLRRIKVAIGRPTAPTPTGRFAITDRLLTGDPEGPYGCCILATSAHSPHAIADWDGGNRIAIHSTPESWSVGLPVSHGCMRVTLADGQWLIERIPLGTPVLISSG